MNQAWKSINGFFVSFTSGLVQLKIYFYTETGKKIPWKLSITIEKEYIYIFFKRELTVLTVVVQWVEAFVYSSNVFGVQGSNPQGANLLWHYTCVAHIASNMMS